LNRVTATEDPLGNYSTSVYDADNRVIATADPLGNRTSLLVFQPKLEELNLFGISLSDSELAELREKLPRCWITQ
jgi:YD repeat-containing protein